MFKKTLSYILIVFGLGVLYASTSRTAMKYISDKRDVYDWWGLFQGKHGDLIDMSALELVKKFYQPLDFTPIAHTAYNGPKQTVLYLQGDSYTRHLQDTFFAGVCSYNYVDRLHSYKYHLDTTKKNILLIEISERYVRSYFSDLKMLDNFSDATIRQGTSQMVRQQKMTEQYASFAPDFSIDDLFNKYINQNLQFNLFNYNFIRPMFECKAALNYYLFNRASGDIVISDNGKFLLLKETVSQRGINSSYAPLASGEASIIVDNFNKLYDHYKAAGFKEIYLSIMPSVATIVQPEGYNNLIPSIQNDPRLKIKTIDVYGMLKNSTESLLLPGDTHWNRKGLMHWLGLVNEQLTKEADER